MKHTDAYLNKTHTLTSTDTSSNIMEAAFGRLHKNWGNPIFMGSMKLDDVSVYVSVCVLL